MLGREKRQTGDRMGMRNAGYSASQEKGKRWGREEPKTEPTSGVMALLTGPH